MDECPIGVGSRSLEDNKRVGTHWSNNDTSNGAGLHLQSICTRRREILFIPSILINTIPFHEPHNRVLLAY